MNSIFPNPFKDKVWLNDESINRIVIYDISGRKLLTTNKLNGELDLGHLKNGTYIFELHKVQRIISLKMIKY